MIQPLRRSLLTRVYLVGVLGLLLTGLVSKVILDRVMEAYRHNQFERHFSAHIEESVTLAAEEAVESFHDGRPDPARLNRLSSALNHQIDWIPWSDSNQYPSELTQQPFLIHLGPPGPGPGFGFGGPFRPNKAPPFQQRHWARIDIGGKPAGVLRFSPNHPRDNPPPLFTILAIVGLVMPAVIWIPATLWLVVRPVRQMMGTAHRLGAGDLESPVDVNRADEFGELQQAFETMRAKIRRMLVERERLLTDISHELRGPLSRLNLAMPLLAQQSGNDAIADLALREIATMDSLIGEILALFRSQSQGIVHETVDLAAIAADVVEARRLVADANGLRLKVQLDPAPTSGDPKLIARAIGNLVDNALKYTGNGGTVHVATHATPQAVICQVTDNGPGIDPEHLPHIWEPFYRPDSSRSRETGGTGLGLSIVQAIVERHGGQAILSSTLGKGTTAIIQLPPSGQTGMLPHLDT